MTRDPSERLHRPPDEGPADIAERIAREGFKSLLPLLALWPGLAIVAAILDRVTPTMFERRVTAWLSDAQRAINELQRRGVNVEALKDDPKFFDFVADATAAAMRTHREEKRRALRNAITNAALGGEREETKARVFLRMIDELDVHHLLLLDLMADPAAFLKARGLPLPGPPPGDHYTERDALTQHQSPRSLLSIVSNVLRDVLPSDLQEIVLQDLVRRGLTTSTFSVLCGVGGSHVTPLGREFVRFIADPVETDGVAAQ